MGKPKTKKQRKIEAFKKDFQKVKNKLGKPKKPPLSSTNLSFKTKAIRIQSQSIAEDKGEYVSSRNLTLKELLAQLSHHNHHVRKDALNGLKELFLRFPQQLYLHLGTVFDHLVLRISDTERSVRKTLHSVLQSAVLPQLNDTIAAPFLPLFILHTSDAMTHMQRDVRLDSLKYIDLWIAAFPHLVSSHARQLLPNYLHLIATSDPLLSSTRALRGAAFTTAAPPEGTTSASLSTTQPSVSSSAQTTTSVSTATTSTPRSHIFQAKVDILSSFYKFLTVVLPTTPPANENEAASLVLTLKSDADAQRGYPELSSQIFRQLSAVPSAALPSLLPCTSVATSTARDADEHKQLATLLCVDVIPQLIRHWLECAPSEPHVALSTVECLATIVDIMRLILSAFPPPTVRAAQGTNSFVEETALNGEAQREYTREYTEQMRGIRKELLRHIMPYFPFVPITRDHEGIAATFLSLNLGLCEVMAHMLEFEDYLGSQARRHGNSETGDKDTAVDDWRGAIVEYLVEALEGRLALQSMTAVDFASPSAGSSMPSTMSIYAQIGPLLRVVKVVLESRTIRTDTKEQLLTAFTKFYRSCGNATSAKRECVAFVATLLLQSGSALRQPDWSYRINPELASQWLKSLPELLWAIKATNLATTRLILKTLIDIGKRPRHGLDVDTLQPALVPFFFTAVVRKSAAAEQSVPKKVYGPFIYLPAELQCMAIDVLYALQHLSEPMIRALTACSIQFERPLESTVRTRLVEMLYHHFCRDSMSLDDFLGIILTIVIGISNPPTPTTPQHAVVMATPASSTVQLPDTSEPSVRRSKKRKRSESQGLMNTPLVAVNTSPQHAASKRPAIEAVYADVVEMCKFVKSIGVRQSRVLESVDSVLSSLIGQYDLPLPTRRAIHEFLAAASFPKCGEVESELPQKLQLVLPEAVLRYCTDIARQGTANFHNEPLAEVLQVCSLAVDRVLDFLLAKGGNELGPEEAQLLLYLVRCDRLEARLVQCRDKAIALLRLLRRSAGAHPLEWGTTLAQLESAMELRFGEEASVERNK